MWMYSYISAQKGHIFSAENIFHENAVIVLDRAMKAKDVRYWECSGRAGGAGATWAVAELAYPIPV